MAETLSKRRKVKTLKQVRDEFRRSGKSVVAWSREHNVSVNLVYEVFRGRACHRGQSHRIAVLLGIKDGVIEDQADHEQN